LREDYPRRRAGGGSPRSRCQIVPLSNWISLPYVRLDRNLRHGLRCIRRAAPVRVARSLWCHGIGSFSIRSYRRDGNRWSHSATSRSSSPNSPRAEHDAEGIAGRDAGAIADCRTPRANDVRPDRCDASISRKRDRHRTRKRQRLIGPFDRSRSWFLYSAFAEAFLAFRRIDFPARLRWLIDLLKP
jgi:hypothetical protein